MLQLHLVVHYDRCHTVVARIPTLHLEKSAVEAVNNHKMISYRTSEVSRRSARSPDTAEEPDKRAMQRFGDVISKSAIAMDLAAEEVSNRLDADPFVIDVLHAVT